jgi:Zn-dependent metalloprotease
LFYTAARKTTFARLKRKKPSPLKRTTMCQNHSKHNRLRCIIPPYINDKLLLSPDADLAKISANSQIQSIALRAKRQFISRMPAPQKSLFGLVAKKAKAAALDMEVYDIRRGTDPAKGILLWRNGSVVQPLDQDAKNVVKAGSGTWDFYYKIFGRNSLDNRGLLLKHFVHYGNTEEDMSNAMWDGKAMVYGDGDGKVFGSFTTDIDIIGHELTHGVTQYESGLEYEHQSGALDESLADVFGIMVKQRMLNLDVKTSNWLIGENVLLGNQYALRSLKAPGKAYVNHPEIGTDPQPATMNKYVTLPNTERGDYGGVHYNSGIPNFAFYVTAYNLGGFAWEKAGRIWYAAMTDKGLKSHATFEDFKALTIKKATALFGAGSKELKATIQGWDEAKV